MALDGIMFEGVSVRVRRPNDYNPAAAAALGPSAPNPNLNLAAIGLGAAKQSEWRPGLSGRGGGCGSAFAGPWAWLGVLAVGCLMIRALCCLLRFG